MLSKCQSLEQPLLPSMNMNIGEAVPIFVRSSLCASWSPSGNVLRLSWTCQILEDSRILYQTFSVSVHQKIFAWRLILPSSSLILGHDMPSFQRFVRILVSLTSRVWTRIMSKQSSKIFVSWTMSDAHHALFQVYRSRVSQSHEMPRNQAGAGL